MWHFLLTASHHVLNHFQRITRFFKNSQWCFIHFKMKLFNQRFFVFHLFCDQITTMWNNVTDVSFSTCLAAGSVPLLVQLWEQLCWGWGLETWSIVPIGRDFSSGWFCPCLNHIKHLNRSEICSQEKTPLDPETAGWVYSVSSCRSFAASYRTPTVSGEKTLHSMRTTDIIFRLPLFCLILFP